METVLKLLNDAFTRLQSLELQPTLHNVTIMQTSLGEIRAAYQKVKGVMDNGNQNGSENRPDEAREGTES